jgi:hypothetical protein
MNLTMDMGLFREIPRYTAGIGEIAIDTIMSCASLNPNKEQHIWHLRQKINGMH